MSVAKSIRELATLIDAGLTPAKSFELVSPHLTALEDTAIGRLELIWKLTNRTGSPIGDTLGRLAKNLEQQQELEHKTAIAFATPAMTAKLIAWLPLVSLAIAQLIGLNPIQAVFTNLIAFISVLIGGCLLFIGNYWTKRMLAAAKPLDVDEGLAAELVAVSLEAGLSTQVSRNQVIAALQLDPDSHRLVEIDSSIQLANRTGAAPAKILLAVADEVRRNKAFEDLSRITKLNVKLLLPIGVTTLPAFALLTLVPVGMSFVSVS
jgi:tight adherence protein B